MNYNTKVKKLSAILSSVAVTLSSTALINFASPITEESDNTSSAQSSASEETVNNSSKSKIITLDKPGDYRLVGIDAASPNSEDPNTIIVNTTDRIIIQGDGEYNIILDNVNIDINNGIPKIEEVYDHWRNGIIESPNEAKINLILEGENVLKTDLCRALFIRGGNLTIIEENQDSSLKINSRFEGMCVFGSNVTINGGTINVNSDTSIGISEAANMTINEGNITSYGTPMGIHFYKSLIVNGGTINASSTSESDPKAFKFKERYGIFSNKWGNFVVNGGIISATGIDGGLHCMDMEINGGFIQANSMAVRDYLTINNGTIETNSITSTWRITLRDGEIIGLQNMNKRPFNIQNVKSGETEIVTSSGTKYLDIIGGTINGVSFPTTRSAAFDKELSSDDNVASEKSPDTVSPAKTPNTGRTSEVNTFLICTFLGLIFTTVTTLKRSKILN